MTEITYTNKDGLNPAEGFVNTFNYRDTDNPDFFDNGNVWGAA